MSKKKKRKPQQRVPQKRTQKPANLAALATAFGKLNTAMQEAKKKQAEETKPWPKFDNRIVEMPDERYGLGFPPVSGEFSAPDDTVTSENRIAWYWRSPDDQASVSASYIKNQDPMAAGQWVIKAFGGTALRTSEQAQWFAGALLSAVGWESIWRKHYVVPPPPPEPVEMGVPLQRTPIKPIDKPFEDLDDDDGEPTDGGAW